jgi:hypothetical protein
LKDRKLGILSHVPYAMLLTYMRSTTLSSKIAVPRIKARSAKAGGDAQVGVEPKTNRRSSSGKELWRDSHKQPQQLKRRHDLARITFPDMKHHPLAANVGDLELVGFSAAQLDFVHRGQQIRSLSLRSHDFLRSFQNYQSQSVPTLGQPWKHLRKGGPGWRNIW